jgi:hypothetical protein
VLFLKSRKRSVICNSTVLTLSMTLKKSVFWDVAPCSLVIILLLVLTLPTWRGVSTLFCIVGKRLPRSTVSHCGFYIAYFRFPSSLHSLCVAYSFRVFLLYNYCRLIYSAFLLQVSSFEDCFVCLGPGWVISCNLALFCDVCVSIRKILTCLVT